MQKQRVLMAPRSKSSLHHATGHHDRQTRALIELFHHDAFGCPGAARTPAPARRSSPCVAIGNALAAVAVA